MQTLLLFVASAVAEIAACYLPYLWLKQGRSIGLLVPAALSLALFAWLLTLHADRCGAGLRRIRRRLHRRGAGVAAGSRPSAPTPWDLAGVAVALCGMDIIMFQPAR